NEIDEWIIRVCFWSEARVVTAHDDSRAGAKPSDEGNDLLCGLTLKCHHRQPYNIGPKVADELLDGLPDPPRNKDQIRNGYRMMRIHISRERCESPIGHSHHRLRHV